MSKEEVKDTIHKAYDIAIKNIQKDIDYTFTEEQKQNVLQYAYDRIDRFIDIQNKMGKENVKGFAYFTLIIRSSLIGIVHRDWETNYKHINKDE